MILHLKENVYTLNHANYIKDKEPIAEQQLKKAGIRLGVLLDYIFK
jgi:hypothetical protein